MTILAWIILGAIAGWIASVITGSRAGLLANIVVGIIGAFVGGLLLALFGADQPSGFSVGSILTAVLGAAILLIIVKNAKRPAV